jgi:phasin family protein
MFTTPEQFVTANKASVDALLSLANIALSSAERIAALNLSTARMVLDTVANSKNLMGAKDPQEAITMTKNQIQPAVEQVVAYNRSLYEISSQAKDEVSKQVENQLGEFQQHIAGLMDKAAKNAPAGSDVAVAAVKTAIEAANSAFGNMKNVVKQATEMTEANIARATSATMDAANLGKKK